PSGQVFRNRPAAHYNLQDAPWFLSFRMPCSLCLPDMRSLRLHPIGVKCLPHSPDTKTQGCRHNSQPPPYRADQDVQKDLRGLPSRLCVAAQARQVRAYSGWLSEGVLTVDAFTRVT